MEFSKLQLAEILWHCRYYKISSCAFEVKDSVLDRNHFLRDIYLPVYVSGIQWHTRQQLLVSLVVAEASVVVKVTSYVLFKLHLTGYTVRSKIFSNLYKCFKGINNLISSIHWHMRQKLLL